MILTHSLSQVELHSLLWLQSCTQPTKKDRVAYGPLQKALALFGEIKWDLVQFSEEHTQDENDDVDVINSSTRLK